MTQPSDPTPEARCTSCGHDTAVVLVSRLDPGPIKHTAYECPRCKWRWIASGQPGGEPE